MNPIEFAIIGTIGLALFALYSARTYELALLKREKLADLLETIQNDSSLPVELKKACLAVFHNSLDQNAVPKIFWGLIRKRYKNVHLSFSSEHQKLLEKLVNEHFFIINFLRAPHWYFLLFVLLLMLVLVLVIFAFATKSIQMLISPLRLFTNPVCAMAGEY